MNIERIVFQDDEGSVEYEGVQLTAENLRAVTVWCRGKGNQNAALSSRGAPSALPPLVLTTGNGEELADYGDWILKDADAVFHLYGAAWVTEANRKGIVG